jgi:hypothetical protein
MQHAKPQLSFWPQAEVGFADLKDPERAFEGERLLCAFNLGRTEAQFQAPPGAWRAVQVVGDARIGHLPPFSGLIATRLT